MKSILLICIGIVINLNAQNRFSNDLVLKVIYTHQYEGNTTSILPYLKHAEERYRVAACMAFASLQDTTAISSLLDVLKLDKSIAVKQAALWGLGQYRLNRLSKLFIQNYKDKNYKTLKNELLIAIGKGATQEDTVFYDKLKISSKDSAQTYSYVYSVFQAYRRKHISKKITATIEKIKVSIKIPSIQKICWYIIPAKRSPLIVLKNEMPPMHFRVSLSQMKRLIESHNPYQVNLILDDKNSAVQNDVLDSVVLSDFYPLVVRSHCMELLLKQKNSIENFDYKRYLESKDLAIIALAVESLRNDSVKLSEKSISAEYLKNIQRALQMPKDFEAWVELEKTICVIEKRTYTYHSWFDKGYTNSIDWGYVNTIQQNQKVKITTNKGVIILECKVNESPASVSNFLKLVDSGYYNGKYFHRMVADFVVQGGCPRGDGWGTLNWTQRSEFSNDLKYKPGSVGLASAGKDSEGVQFFITHTYTPHLDGRYTIFAEVIIGMGVVNSLLVGDVIISIEKV